jgi:tripartite-type tricarboxylate transporter receptor subunit TctC
MISLISGDVHMMLIAPTLAMPNAQSGKLRALAVTSLEPSPLAPGVPTVAATGLPGYECISLLGLLARTGTPPAVLSRLNQEITRVLSRADVKAQFIKQGGESVGSSPAQFSDEINSEIAKWGRILREAGITRSS